MDHDESQANVTKDEAVSGAEFEVSRSPDQTRAEEARDAARTAYSQLREAKREMRRAEEDLAGKVAELQIANRQLAQLDRMKDNFLSLLSHELRTPISAILGYASILDDELAGPVPVQQREYLRKVMEAAEKLLKLVNDVLDMNRLQSGQMTFESRPVGLPEIVENVLASRLPVAEEKGVRVIIDIPPDLPPFLADEQRLSQVLANLIDNGIHFTERGVVTVRARREDDMLRIEIEDTGAGIPADELPKLFRVFGQLDDSSTRQTGGLGLGLALAKGLTEGMRGVIAIESELGKGTKVVVHLPFVPVRV